jgi:uncharacterized protein YqeY
LPAATIRWRMRASLLRCAPSVFVVTFACRKPAMTMKLRDRINQDLTAAMKARDTVRLGVLRMMKTAVKNKEIETRNQLEDGSVIQVLSTLIRQRRDSIEQFSRGGREDLAKKEAAEIEIIEEYLPASVSDEEIAHVVEEVVRSIGATSVRDMGAVMKECMARLAGKLVDGRKVSEIVRQRLS